MTTWVTTISTRYASLAAAVLMAFVCWTTHAAALCIAGDQTFVAALFPQFEGIGGRALMALATAFVAAVGVHGYSRALRRKVAALSDSDLHYRTVLETTSDSIITRLIRWLDERA